MDHQRGGGGHDLTLRQRLSDLVRRPAAWHVVTLVLAAVFIAVVGRNQWFFYDEWAFLRPDFAGVLFAPHVGHWSTAPVLIDRVLLAVFGLHTYLPYLALVVAAHLALCHVLWRIALRAGANPWVATALAFLLALFGAGAENILWAFQVGFVGAILLGAIVLLLLDRPVLGPGRVAAVVAFSILSLTFSGTAVPVLLGAGLLSLARRGPRLTALLLAPSAVVYVAWYVLIGRFGNPGLGVGSVSQLGVDVPRYVGHYLVDGLDDLTPLPGAGVLIVAGLLVWALSRFREWPGNAAAAYAAAAAAVVLGIFAGITRVALGAEQASSSRYVYALFALLVPLIAAAVTRFAELHTRVLVPTIAFIVLLTGYQAAVLGTTAGLQAAQEQATRQRLAAALDLILADPGRYDPGQQVEPQLAPDLRVADLLGMHERGWLDVMPYDAAARLTAVGNLDLTIATAVAVESCEPLPQGRLVSVDSGVVLRFNSPSVIGVAVTDGAVSGDTRAIAASGTVRLTLDAPGSLNLVLSEDAAPVELCGPTEWQDPEGMPG